MTSPSTGQRPAPDDPTNSRPPSRRSRAVLGIPLGVAIVFGLTQLPFPHRSLIVDAVLDAGHTPLFSVFTWIVWRGLHRDRGRSFTRALVGAILVALALGVITEATQHLTGRHASLDDLLRDAIGVAIATLLLLAGPGLRGGAHGARRPLRGLLLVLSAALSATAAQPVLHTLRAYQHRAAIFPVLFDFESAEETVFFLTRDADLARVPLRSTDPRAGLSARVRFRNATDPAFILREPAANWSGFAALEFDVHLDPDLAPEAIPALWLRVDDASRYGSDRAAHDDQIHLRLALSPGPNALRIPLQEMRRAPSGREFDLRHVTAMTFFVHPSPTPSTVIFDRIRLTDEAAATP